MWKRWKEHLANNSMTYKSHFMFAASHGVRCIKAGVLLIIHALLPCYWRRTGSMLVHELSKDFFEHRLDFGGNNDRTNDGKRRRRCKTMRDK